MQGPQPASQLTVQVGVDIVGVERIARLVTAHPGAVEALFTPAEQARLRGLRDLDVSISHSDGLALAHAVAVCDNDPSRGGADAVSPD